MSSLQRVKTLLQSVSAFLVQKIAPAFLKVYDFKAMFAIDVKTHQRAIIFSAILIFLVLLIQNPASVFTGNLKEFRLNTLDYFGYLVPAFIIGAIIAALPVIFLRRRLLALYAVSVTFLALLIWLYSNLIVINFGELDGGNFDFSGVNKFRRAEAFFLVIGFSTLFYIYKKYSKQTSYIMATLNVIVAVSVVIQLGSNFQSENKYSASTNDVIYRFSETKNVLIVLMDQFQSDIFSDLVENRPALKDELEGFTFFPDALGVAPTTRLTMPSIHSGEFYKTGPQLTQFYETNVERGSFLNSIAEADHDVVLVSPAALGCPENAILCKGVWPTVFQRNDLLRRELFTLVDFSLFRASPIIGKPRLYNNGEWILSEKNKSTQHFVVTANRFLTQLTSLMHASGDKPATKFLHLMNTHRPYVVDAQCKFTGNNRSENRRTQMYNQSSCAMDKFVSVLDKLKSLGIYDNTTIMLIADTGVGAFNVGSSHGSDIGGVRYAGAGLYGAANPVFLVKPMNARNDYTISEKPVQLTDVAATICDLTEDCSGFPGQSVFAEIVEERARQYNIYYLSQEWNANNFVPDPLALTVTGPVWEMSSWPENFQANMSPGQEFKFNHDEYNSVLLGEGWGGIGQGGTLTYAEEATIYFTPENDLASAYDLTVNIEEIFSQRNSKGDTVDVFANGQLIKSWSLSSPGKFSEKKVTLTKEIIESQEHLEITFKMKSPKAWVVKRDNVRHVRTRGFKLVSAKFSRLSQ